ncbi:hypothetical protein Acr_00g0051330 [Actinidia rufa]|uniref:Uncharacterized protein n=1 Tax=Actinidia rufa TaxID=165716 RepID=A0A7J0DMP4_9ERIC|nr:hypothetical protein Acr_00g0051330 [Actinidia rufa]
MKIVIIFDISKLLCPSRNRSPFKATNSSITNKQSVASSKCSVNSLAGVGYRRLQPSQKTSSFNLYFIDRSQLMDIIWMTMFPVEHVPYLKETIHEDYTAELKHRLGELGGFHWKSSIPFLSLDNSALQ